MRTLVVAIALLAGARAAAAKPAALHADAVPDADRWWCFTGGCEREEGGCHAAAGSDGGRCAAQDAAWVATGQDAKTACAEMK